MALNLMQTIKVEKIPKGRVLHPVYNGNWSKCYKNAIIDGGDKIENVFSMEIVITNMIFWKKKWVDYKNYT